MQTQSLKTTKTCSHCQTEIPLKAKKCPNCQSDLRNWFSQHPIKALFAVMVGVPLFIATSGMGGSNSESSQNNVQNLQTWNYETKTDEFSGVSESYARIQSTNQLDFEFPYNGGSNFFLTVRNVKKGQGEEVILETDNGQFMSYEDYVKVRFDEGAPITYYVSGTEDSNSKVLFINNPTNFISNLKKSSTIKIEAPFYNEGRQVIYFNTKDYQGLK